MSKVYLLDTTDLSILAEAENYEAIYDLMCSDKFDSFDTIVSPNPSMASLIIWEDSQLDRSIETEDVRESSNTIK